MAEVKKPKENGLLAENVASDHKKTANDYVV